MIKRALSILLVSVALIFAFSGIAPLLADTVDPASGGKGPALRESPTQPGPEAGVGAAAPTKTTGDRKVVAKGPSGNAAGVVAPVADRSGAGPLGVEPMIARPQDWRRNGGSSNRDPLRVGVTATWAVRTIVPPCHRSSFAGSSG